MLPPPPPPAPLLVIGWSPECTPVESVHCWYGYCAMPSSTPARHVNVRRSVLHVFPVVTARELKKSRDLPFGTSTPSPRHPSVDAVFCCCCPVCVDDPLLLYGDRPEGVTDPTVGGGLGVSSSSSDVAMTTATTTMVTTKTKMPPNNASLAPGVIVFLSSGAEKKKLVACHPPPLDSGSTNQSAQHFLCLPRCFCACVPFLPSPS